MSELASKILEKAKAPDERSLQKLIGASQVGGCPYCLGHALMGTSTRSDLPSWVVDDSEEGLAAWIGTAVHYYLENKIIPQVMEEEGWDKTKIVPEENVTIFELPGYGTIKGNIDVHDTTEVVDWKIVGDWSYNMMSLDSLDNPNQIPRKQYRVQQMLYAYGLRQLGHDIEKVSLAVFKKTSNNWRDVKIYTEYYNQAIVDAALENLQKIYDLAKQGKFDELPQEKECYDCSRRV